MLIKTHIHIAYNRTKKQLCIMPRSHVLFKGLTWQRTNELKINVFFTLTAWSLLSCSKLRILLPRKLRTRRTVTWYRACSCQSPRYSSHRRKQWVIKSMKKTENYVSDEAHLYYKVSPHDICYKWFPEITHN